MCLQFGIVQVMKCTRYESAWAQLPGAVLTSHGKLGKVA